MNPHPPLSGIPIAVVVLVALLEIKSVFFPSEKDSAIRDFLIGGLAVFIPLTYYSGFWGAEFASVSFEVAQAQIANHQLYAKVLLITDIVLVSVYLLSRTYQKQILRSAYLLVVLVTLLLTIFVSHLGGELVFESGAGVRAKNPALAPADGGQPH